jgi:hypothetical protein
LKSTKLGSSPCSQLRSVSLPIGITYLAVIRALLNNPFECCWCREYHQARGTSLPVFSGTRNIRSEKRAPHPRHWTLAAARCVSRHYSESGKWLRSSLQRHIPCMCFRLPRTTPPSTSAAKSRDSRAWVKPRYRGEGEVDPTMVLYHLVQMINLAHSFSTTRRDAS